MSLQNIKDSMCFKEGNLMKNVKIMFAILMTLVITACNNTNIISEQFLSKPNNTSESENIDDCTTELDSAPNTVIQNDMDEIKGLIDFSKKNISFKTKMLKIDVFDLDSDGTKDLVCFGIDEDMNIKSGCFFSFDKQTGQYCLNTDLFYRYPLMAYGKYRNQSEEEFYIVLHTRSTRVGNTFTMRNMNGETSTLFFDSVFDNRKDNSLTPFYEVNNFVGKCLDCEIPYTKIEHVNWECLVSEEDYCRLRSELVSAVEFVPTNILTVTIAYEQYSDLDADEIFEKLEEEELVDCFTGDSVSEVTDYSYLNWAMGDNEAFTESENTDFNFTTSGGK